MSLDVVQEARHEQDEAIGYLRKQAREHLETIYYWLAALLLGEMLTATR